MPQKRNPDLAELIRGKTGRVYGSLVTLLTLLKGLPLAYNRDLQEDKPPLFETVEVVVQCLKVMTPMIRSLKVNEDCMRQQCEEGYLCATELADYLTKKGTPFRSAHGIVQKIVRTCQLKKIRLNDLSVQELKTFHRQFDEDVTSVLTPEKAVHAKTSFGGTSPQSVRRQIEELRRLIQ